MSTIAGGLSYGAPAGGTSISYMQPNYQETSSYAYSSSTQVQTAYQPQSTYNANVAVQVSYQAPQGYEVLQPSMSLYAPQTQSSYASLPYNAQITPMPTARVNAPSIRTPVETISNSPSQKLTEIIGSVQSPNKATSKSEYALKTPEPQTTAFASRKKPSKDKLANLIKQELKGLRQPMKISLLVNGEEEHV